jgi:hypothetical protein
MLANVHDCRFCLDVHASNCSMTSPWRRTIPSVLLWWSHSVTGNGSNFKGTPARGHAWPHVHAAASSLDKALDSALQCTGKGTNRW